MHAEREREEERDGGVVLISSMYQRPEVGKEWSKGKRVKGWSWFVMTLVQFPV